jgi:hypothetical protein
MPAFTPNYNLTQPTAEEFYDVGDFNRNAGLIDTALKNMDTAMKNISNQISEGPVVTGTYNGNGSSSRFISLGFTPKAVLLFTAHGGTIAYAGGTLSDVYGGLAITGGGVVADHAGTSGSNVLNIAANGFNVYYAAFHGQPNRIWVMSNVSGWRFSYVAIR